MPSARLPHNLAYASIALALAGAFAGIVSLALTALLVLGALVVASGLVPKLTPARGVFVLAGALVTAFLFVRVWLRLPAYGEVSDFLERSERLTGSGLLRALIYAFLAVAGVGIVVALVATIGLGPRQLGIVGAGLAMLALLGATFNVGVTRVLAALEMGLDNAAENRKKRKLYLNAASIGLSILGLAVGALTFFAFLYQAAGLQLFKFLLDFYVRNYSLIFAVAFLPLVGTVLLRTRVQTEVAYSDKLKALSMGLATVCLVLVFFGVFIVAGFAQGSGII